MATPNGTVTFEAAGVTRRLRLSTNALCILEDKTGSTILEIGGEFAFGISMATLRAIFYAGGDDGDVTLAQAGDLIDAIGIERARALAEEAFRAAFPVAEADDEARPPMAAAG